LLVILLRTKVEDKLVNAKKPAMRSGYAQLPSRAAKLALVGGELAFDFTNTTSGRGSPRPREHLQTAEHIVVWAHHAKIIAKERVKHLCLELARSPRLARELLRRTLDLRDVVYAIGSALGCGKPPSATDIDRLAEMHAQCLRLARLQSAKGVYVWTWEIAARPIEAILGPITLSALSLLSQADLSRVKQCKGADCGWLFFDATKNKNRRWCEMEVCGNRAKQRRLRQRRP
jgi:predicted RNA-binding Zn ribbon-like protein